MVRDLHQSGKARDREEDAPEPPQIRRFRRLVSFTMVVMIVGILGIMAALVWKLTQTPHSVSHSALQAKIEIPAGFDLITISRSNSSLFLVLENAKTGEKRLEERDSSSGRVIAKYALSHIQD